MKNVVLFHGYNGKDKSDWMLWLEKELTKENVPVTFLSYENSKQPNMDEWQELYKPIIQDINDETIFVCHSFGCLVAMKLLERTGLNIPKLILVACPKNDLSGDTLSGLFSRISDEEKQVLTEFAEQKFDWDKVENCAADITFLYSDNDHAVPYEETLKYYQPLFHNAEFKHYKNYGHFNRKADIYEMPDIIELIG